jgi:3,4-dihydroxy-2-butanone 4-phosphate synthase
VTNAAVTEMRAASPVPLCRLAGLAPVAVIAEVVHADSSMMRLPALLDLGAAYDLPVVGHCGVGELADDP